MDELKQLLNELNAGTITLAQYKRKAAALLSKMVDDNEITDEQYESEIAAVNQQTEPDSGDDEGGNSITPEEVARREQAAADKVRTEYNKKQRELQKQIDDLRKANMTESEKAKHQEEELQKREQELRRKEVRLHAVDELTVVGLPVTFSDFVIAEDEEQTSTRINDLKTLFDKELQAAVKRKIAEAGGDPNKGKGSGGAGSGDNEPNPWKQGSWDVAKQNEMILNDPDKAMRLKAAASA